MSKCLSACTVIAVAVAFSSAASAGQCSKGTRSGGHVVVRQHVPHGQVVVRSTAHHQPQETVVHERIISERVISSPATVVTTAPASAVAAAPAKDIVDTAVGEIGRAHV